MKHKHSIGFSPKFNKEFKSKVKPRVYLDFAKQAFAKLDWELIFESDSEIIALRENDIGSATEKITVKTTTMGTIHIQSKSQNGFWDMGKNSKRVNELYSMVESEISSLSEIEIEESERKLVAQDNWENYIIPESLPKPNKYRKPLVIIPTIGYLLLAISFGYLLSTLSIYGTYVIILYEIIIGFIFAYSLKVFLPLSNYTHGKNLASIILISIIATYFLNQYFQFIHFRAEFTNLTFSTFITTRLKSGLVVKELNTGTVGLIISWIIQIGLTYVVAYLKCFNLIMNYSIKRVPDEVTEFVMYYLIQSKSEQEIRDELTKKGWKNQQEQDMVFEAIGWIGEGLEYNKNI